MNSTDVRRYGAAGAVVPLLGSIISLCIGTSYAKTVFPVAGPAGMTALRLGLSMLLIAALQRPWRWRLGRAELVAVTRYGRRARTDESQLLRSRSAASAGRRDHNRVPWSSCRCDYGIDPTDRSAVDHMRCRRGGDPSAAWIAGARARLNWRAVRTWRRFLLGVVHRLGTPSDGGPTRDASRVPWADHCGAHCGPCWLGHRRCNAVATRCARDWLPRRAPMQRPALFA